MGHLNQLSQLLYWGNVLGNLGGLLVFFGILLVIATIVSIITAFVFADSGLKLKNKVWIPSTFSAAFFILTLCSWTGAAFCPSKETVYAIAASEMGERALQTPLASKAGKALEAWLDKQITPPVVSSP